MPTRISETTTPPPVAVKVLVTDDTLTAELHDGRAISAPLAWYPRLMHGTAAERANCHLTGGGEGMHWPDLDEDISVANLLQGQPSGESPASLTRWLDARRKGKGITLHDLRAG